jgi:hypothetical protein
MADQVPSRTAGKWLWPLVIALLAVLLLIWLLNPSGDRDEGQVEDPIVTPELGEEPAPGVNELDLEADAAAEAAANRDAAGTTTTTEPAPAPAAGQ